MTLGRSSKSVERYRAEAARLRRDAERAPTLAIKQELLAVADGYDRLAKSVELIALGGQLHDP
jgi:hypothetical protein